MPNTDAENNYVPPADAAENVQGEPEGWQEAVWRAYCKGNRRINTLVQVAKASGGPAHWHSVDRFVKRQLKALAIHGCAETERVAYEEGLQADLEDADAILNRAVNEGNTNGQVGALRVKMDARERLAASRGVITQRKSAEVSGPDGGPVRMSVEAWWQGMEAAEEHTEETQQ